VGRAIQVGDQENIIGIRGNRHLKSVLIDQRIGLPSHSIQVRVAAGCGSLIHSEFINLFSCVMMIGIGFIYINPGSEGSSLAKRFRN